MEASQLKQLPVELRLQIYELALTEKNPVKVLFVQDEQNADRKLSSFDPECSLALTCKQIRTECQPVFFNSNIFLIRFNEFVRDAQGMMVLHTPRSIRQYVTLPLFWFARGLRNMRATVSGLHLHIGTFHAGFNADLSMLGGAISWLAMLATNSPLKQLLHKNNNDEFAFQFVILEDPLPTERPSNAGEVHCSVDCRDLNKSLLKISRMFAVRAIPNVGEVAAIRWRMYKLFLIWAERDWSKKGAPVSGS